MFGLAFWSSEFGFNILSVPNYQKLQTGDRTVWLATPVICKIEERKQEKGNNYQRN
eukprot:c49288_g1_i1 orf=123-290(+)